MHASPALTPLTSHMITGFNIFYSRVRPPSIGPARRKKMSYQHIHHPPQPQGFGGPPYPSAVPPAGFPYDAPPPPPPRGGPGYQDYFGDQGGYSSQPLPPPVPPVYEHTHHYHSGDDFRARCWSLWRGCCAALCCCCVLEECCL